MLTFKCLDVGVEIHCPRAVKRRDKDNVVLKQTEKKYTILENFYLSKYKYVPAPVKKTK